MNSIAAVRELLENISCCLFVSSFILHSPHWKLNNPDGKMDRLAVYEYLGYVGGMLFEYALLYLVREHKIISKRDTPLSTPSLFVFSQVLSDAAHELPNLNSKQLLPQSPHDG